MSPPLQVRVVRPLDGFDLDVAIDARAQVTGVFGPSGAGKSSLLEAVAGIARGVAGTIRFGDEVWLDSARGVDRPPEARDVGYVPQDGLLFPHRDVRGNLLAGARRARRRGQDAATVFATIADLLELRPLLDRDVGALSGGERQRVALGRALCSGPRLLLLDEPLAALDLPLRRRLLPVLDRVRRELTVPMLLVSHDPTEVQALCDEVVVLRAGRVVAGGVPRRVLTDPDVFPLTRGGGFENVLSGALLSTEGGISRVALGGDVVLTTPPAAAGPGAQVLLGVPAHEILLATSEPVGLSARNVLPARIAAVETVGDVRLVTAEIPGVAATVAVEVTGASTAELGLEPGARVYLVIKVRSCVLYGPGPHPQTPSP